MIIVDGIVAIRDKQPYVRLFKDKEQICQLSVSEARQIAEDILNMCARTEADAMLIKFFKTNEFPDGAAEALLVNFREFRAKIDDEQVKHSHRINPIQ